MPTRPGRHLHHDTSLNQHLRFPIGKDTATIQDGSPGWWPELSLFPPKSAP
ncbi:hypothetical protein ACFY8V_20545 [Streptomyces californicus]|uniref:hypothetical protein n=1 Tax=Streptomyces californicus TaxID=67351 RepID=UPI0036B39B11